MLGSWFAWFVVRLVLGSWFGLPGQDRDGGAEVGLRRVVKFAHERVLVQRALNDAALDAFAAAVNQTHLPQSCSVRGADVFVDDRRDVLGQKGMKVEAIVDRDLRSAP